MKVLKSQSSPAIHLSLGALVSKYWVDLSREEERTIGAGSRLCARKIQDFLPNLIKRTNLKHWHQHVIFGPLALPPVLVLSPSKSLDTFTCHVDQQLRCHRSFLALSTASCMTP